MRRARVRRPSKRGQRGLELPLQVAWPVLHLRSQDGQSQCRIGSTTWRGSSSLPWPRVEAGEVRARRTAAKCGTLCCAQADLAPENTGLTPRRAFRRRRRRQGEEARSLRHQVRLRDYDAKSPDPRAHFRELGTDTAPRPARRPTTTEPRRRPDLRTPHAECHADGYRRCPGQSTKTRTGRAQQAEFSAHHATTKGPGDAGIRLRTYGRALPRTDGR